MTTAKYEEFLSRSRKERIEFIAGEITPLAQPSKDHAEIHTLLPVMLAPLIHFKGEGPKNNWKIYTELDLLLGEDTVRPDVCGFRAARITPETEPSELTPDWICEIISPSNPKNDQITKRKLYLDSKVPFYWLLDSRPEFQFIEALELHENHWRVVGTFTAEDTQARIPPFDAIFLDLSKLLSGSEK